MISLRTILPLRQASVWGQFAAPDVVPVRYGAQRGRAIQYDRSKLRFVWADHASQIVTAVYVDGQLSLGWTWRNQSDVTGRAVTMIEFAQPQSGAVTAVGVGKTDPTSGSPITRPGAIIADLARLGGRTLDVSWLDYEAARLGIECAGSIDALDTTLQGAISAICQSIGAVYAARGHVFARIYPGGLYDGGSAASEGGITIPATDLRTADTTADAVVNAVLIEYAYRDDAPAAAIELDCPDSIARFGRRELRLEARWIGDARVAEAYARRLITAYAEPRWEISADTAGDVRPLVVLYPGTDVEGPEPEATIALAGSYEPTTETTSGLVFERLRPTGAEIRIVRQASLIEDAQLSTATVETIGTTRRIKLLDAQGGPLANAKVVLNGTVTRYSDGAGYVIFPVADTPPGTHTLTITDPATQAVTNLQILIA